MLWALVECLRRDGFQVQGFLSEASFSGYRDTATATGLHPRHLDSWLMSPEMCRAVFDRGSRAADLSIVYGRFASQEGWGESPGSHLEPICDWLGLPRVAIVDASRIGSCRLPPRPVQTEALLLDRVRDVRHLSALATDLEALWGIPVVGALPELSQLRARMSAEGGDQGGSRDICRELGNWFIRRGDRAIPGMFSRGEAGGAAPAPEPCNPCLARMTIAVAYDEAFHCYFPDVLEQLEAHGATVVDFSPLHDEALPDRTGLVYLGCGCPERFATPLADNHCMKLALGNHLRRGGRIYGEGGGLAYLCQQMETLEGTMVQAAGIIPATAALVRQPGPPEPVEVTLSRPNWLGAVGARVRGYRNPRWRLEPAGPLVGLASQRESVGDLVGTFHAVGSRLHLHFAAMPHLLHNFFHPCTRCLAVSDPWTAVQ